MAERRIAPKLGAEPEEEVDFAKLGKNADAIAKSLTRLEKGGMTRNAVVALIYDDTKMARRDIHAVLNSLQGLRAKYFPAPKGKGRATGRRQT